MAVIGLRTATEEDIAELKRKYPFGKHVTCKSTGKELPFNGVFYTKARTRARHVLRN